MTRYKLTKDQLPLVGKYAKEMTFRTIGERKGGLENFVPYIIEHTISHIVVNKHGTFIYTIDNL